MRYADDRVHASFNFRERMDDHVNGSSGSSAQRAAAKALEGALLDVMHQVRTVDEIMDADPLLYAKHHERLRRLEADVKSRRPRHRAQIGKDYSRAVVLVTGDSHSGKSPVAEEIVDRLTAIAARAGERLRLAKPAGRRAGQDIGDAELVNHDDARYQILPGYDEALRYLDKNNSTKQDGRNYNRPAWADPVS